MNDATPVLLTSLSCHPLARGTSGPGSRPSFRAERGAALGEVMRERGEVA